METRTGPKFSRSSGFRNCWNDFLCENNSPKQTIGFEWSETTVGDASNSPERDPMSRNSKFIKSVGVALIGGVLTLATTTQSAERSATPAANGLYHFLREIPIGGEGGWDILTIDSEASRLYLSHATKVVVVDLSTN